MTDDQIRNLTPAQFDAWVLANQQWTAQQQALGEPTNGATYAAFKAAYVPIPDTTVAPTAPIVPASVDAPAPISPNGTTAPDGTPVADGSYQSGFIDNPPAVTGLPGTSAFDISSDPSTGKSSLTRKKTDTGVSGDNSRLQIIRPRSARTLYDNNGRDTYTSDRGPIATMKLLPGPGYDASAAVKDATSDVSDDVNSLLAGKFANFFLTDIQFGFNEKMQITQTFGDNEVVYYFGRQPLIINLSGLLFDSLENDWFSKFLTLYAGVLRGTELAKSFSLVEIMLPNMTLRGTIASLSANQNSNRDTDIPFSFQFVAKSVVPLPAILPTGPAVNNIGTLVDFKATRQGVAGYTLSSGGLGGGFMEASKTFGDVTQGASGALASAASGIQSSGLGLAAAAADVNSSLNGFRTNIFTPVFGVISSIAKIVKTVTGTIKSIVSSFADPVNKVLGDIQNISAQVSGIANLVESSINSVIAVPARIANNARNTVRSLKKTAGTITRVPENVSQTFKRLYGSGHLRGKAVLSSGKARTKSKAAVLTSGAPYTPSTSNKL